MEVVNQNCDYLELNSDSIDSLLRDNHFNYLNVKVSLKDKIFEGTLTEEHLSDGWVSSIIFTNETVITQICLKNIFTNQKYELLPSGSEYHINPSELASLRTTLIDSANNVLGINTVDVQFTITNDILDIIFTGLPSFIKVDKIYYSTLGTAQNTIFYQANESGIIVSGNDVILLPEFFGGKLISGVYDITLEVVSDSGTITIEQVCFFVDCGITEQLINSIDVDNCKRTDINIIMLYYSLKEASNKLCDCSKMHEIYDYLENHLNNYNINSCEC